MNRNGLRLIKILPIIAVAVLVFASAANPQATERRAPEISTQAGTVAQGAPAIDLKAVGREVAPGVFEVDPGSLHGKRLILPATGGTAKQLCIGKWDGGSCRGIYIQW